MCSVVRLLAVSEDFRIRDLIKNSLESEGHEAHCVSSIQEAIQALGNGSGWNFLLYDTNIRQDPSALYSYALTHQIQSEGLCILADARETFWESYVQQWQVRNVLMRPLQRHDMEKLLSLPCCAKEDMPAPKYTAAAQPAQQKNSVVLEELGAHGFFLAASPTMQKIYKEICILASVDYPVLILGESGVGKEVVARVLHKHHPRSKENFFNINTAAIPSELLESELFGYEAGAFTGAVKAKPGKFELANNGTLLLDEIGEMNLQMQTKLLHVLQDGSFSRLGSQFSTRSDVRILAATNVNMEEAIAQKRFREDLYYRLSTFTMTIPPLRERREEIPLLIEQMMTRGVASTGLEPFSLSDRLMEAAQEYHWPGNLRELRNFVHRLLVLGDQDAAYEGLRAKTRAKAAEDGRYIQSFPVTSSYQSMKSAVSDVKYETEARMIKEALSAVGWNRRRAANNLNISYRSLLYKIQQHKISA